ncbi:MAG: ion channel [Spirochaetes bacterium]|nr:ion channel [Spirochaetota bacterium]
MKNLLSKIVFLISSNLFKIILSSILIILFFSFIILIIENQNHQGINNFFDSIWYIIVTFTTTGYGDVVPQTKYGKIIGLLTIIFGVVLTALITGELASILIELQQKKGKGLMDYSKKKEHIIICGWKNDFINFIKELLTQNPDLGASDIVILNNEPLENIQSILADPELMRINYVHGEYFDESSLLRAGLLNAKKVIILADDTGRYSQSEIDSKNVMTVLTIEKLNKNTYICAEIFDSKFVKYLQQSHCDEIVLSKDFSKKVIINSISTSGFSNIIEEIINPKNNSRLQTLEISQEFIGKKFEDLFNHYKNNDNLLIGLLENVGNFYIRKTEAIKEAQKTPDISKLVENLKLIKKLKPNEPIINPPSNYIIKPKSYAIVLTRTNK